MVEVTYKRLLRWTLRDLIGQTLRDLLVWTLGDFLAWCLWNYILIIKLIHVLLIRRLRINITSFWLLLILLLHFFFDFNFVRYGNITIVFGYESSCIMVFNILLSTTSSASYNVHYASMYDLMSNSNPFLPLHHLVDSLSLISFNTHEPYPIG